MNTSTPSTRAKASGVRSKWGNIGTWFLGASALHWELGQPARDWHLIGDRRVERKKLSRTIQAARERATVAARDRATRRPSWSQCRTASSVSAGCSPHFLTHLSASPPG